MWNEQAESCGTEALDYTSRSMWKGTLPAQLLLCLFS